ncbi:MAG: hypothetical protein WC600_03150 [Desulfobaccales bacterium]
MQKRLAVIVAVVTITCLMGWVGGQKEAAAAEINILPYYVAGSVGDSWTYSFIYIDPAYPSTPDFTVNLTQVTSGDLAGKYRIGDFVDIIDSPHIRWSFVDWDASGINIYATESAVYSPPLKIAAMQPLGVMFDPLPDLDEHTHVFQRLGSLTVLAGTFDDVLVDITLTKLFGPSDANAEFGLDPVAFPYQVTHVVWYAAGFGEIQNRDYEPSEGGPMLFEYQLQATSVVPVPAPLVMLGSGLLGLLVVRRRFPH